MMEDPEMDKAYRRLMIEGAQTMAALIAVVVLLLWIASNIVWVG